MDRTTQERLIGLIFTDHRFREALLRDPVPTLQNSGFAPLPELVDAITNADHETIRDMAAKFESSQLGGWST